MEKQYSEMIKKELEAKVSEFELTDEVAKIAKDSAKPTNAELVQVLEVYDAEVAIADEKANKPVTKEVIKAPAVERVTEAVKQALTHPLLDVDYQGASGALIHVTCGPDLKLEEFDIIGRLVSENLSPDAQVIIGARISKEFTGRVRVITIMTGVKSPYVLGKMDQVQSVPVSREISDLGIEVF